MYNPNIGVQIHMCGGWDLAEWLESVTANTEVSTFLGSMLASFDTVEYDGRQMKQSVA